MPKTKPRKTSSSEIETLRRRLQEAEETLQAIRNGEVDAVLVTGPQGEQVFTLRDANRPYRHLVEQMQEGACTLDAQGIVFFANSYFVRLLGARLEQVLGLSFSRWIREKDRARFAQMLSQSLKSSARGEIELISAEGEPLPIQLSLSLLRTEEDKQVTVVIFDLRERKRSEQALRRMNEELEQRVSERTFQLQELNEEYQDANEELVKLNRHMEKEIAERQRTEERVEALNRELERHTAELAAANRELESFSYSVSHDLRTPLVSIESFARMVLQNGDMQLSEEGRRFLQLIQENAHATNLMVEALLMFSRTSRQPLKKQEIKMRKIVDQVLSELSAAETRRRIDWVIGDLPVANADPVLLRQVWTNLISNAIKYTRHCDVARIEIGMERQDNQEAYFVKDNGVGFDMTQAEELFGVFQRLHSEEEYEGTGVGLAIVGRIVQRHGGRVWAHAEVDKGATFYFTLG